MPLVTPTVQQAEQASDAADAHVSVGKMEMISRAVAKMTNSAAASELTAIELFGASVSKFANKFTSYSNDSSLIIDMAAKPDDRQFWDLGTREDQETGANAAKNTKTELLIGSAPCISFRTFTAPLRERNERVN